MKFGIIFCGNSADRKKTELQKKSVRIMTGTEFQISCKALFRALELLTLPSQYILSLITFLAHNLEYFSFNFSVHSINTRKKVHLHSPIANFA
jgi:hypothetical protein